MPGMTKFNIKFHEAMYQLVSALAKRLDASMADVIREALSLYAWTAQEYEGGGRLLLQKGDEITQVVIPSLERLRAEAGPDTQVVPVGGLGRRRRASETDGPASGKSWPSTGRST